MSPNRARASSSRHVRQSPCGSDDKHATQEAVVLPVVVVVVVRPPRRILSRSSSRPTPHVQTEDYEETLSEYILGQEYGRFFFKTHLFRATARVARSRTTGLNRAARTKHKNYPPFFLVLNAEINDLSHSTVAFINILFLSHHHASAEYPIIIER
jgi:hypothetical protein